MEKQTIHVPNHHQPRSNDLKTIQNTVLPSGPRLVNMCQGNHGKSSPNCPSLQVK